MNQTRSTIAGNRSKREGRGNRVGIASRWGRLPSRQLSENRDGLRLSPCDTLNRIHTRSVAPVPGAPGVLKQLIGHQRATRAGPIAYVQTVVTRTGLNAPEGIAVDEIGNVYIADTGNDRVLEEKVSGSAYSQSVFARLGLNSPGGVAARGNSVYVSDSANNRVLNLDPPPTSAQLP